MCVHIVDAFVEGLQTVLVGAIVSATSLVYLPTWGTIDGDLFIREIAYNCQLVYKGTREIGGAIASFYWVLVLPDRFIDALCLHRRGQPKFCSGQQARGEDRVRSEAEKAQLAVVEDHMQEKAEDWNLSKEAIEAAAQLMLSDGQSLPTDLDERGIMLLFLYAKGISRQATSAVRRAEFAALLTPDDNYYYEQSLQRLGRLVLEGERSDSVLDKCNSFTRFLDSVPAWQDNAASYVAFRDDPRISCGLLERVQLSGLCYMHAPIVLQAYLVAMHAGSQTGASKMLDLADYIRKHRTAQELKNHIFEDEGGSGEAFLRQILANASGLEGFACTQMVDEVVGQAIINRIISNLKQFGPALVSGFMVTENFLEAKIHEHLGQDNSTEVGLHSMVLVGHRKESGQDRFLLQSWWSDKSFIEVDADYLAAQQASLVFVQAEQPDIPAQFSRNSARHVELEMTVKERLPMEM
ncbi:unnamed protein product [Symbiodinium necroappetens]|uniref:Uncharacterized protein n=1 Tax=Symbiodinium necroappetens TaxID=1628268 RepID=A0A812K1C0_9DINO|nr:unnamed protein product [Symbiodinium necroappetens]